MDKNIETIKKALKETLLHSKTDFCKRSLVLNIINMKRSKDKQKYMTLDQFNNLIKENKNIFKTTNCSVGFKE